MTANFLHGVETIILSKGARQIRQVKTAVIGLVGTAPTYLVDAADKTVNDLQLVLSDRDASKYFGEHRKGYTIPAALEAIYDQGYGTVIVVNVFDSDTHHTHVSNASKTFDVDEETLDLGYEGILSDSLVITSSDGNTTYDEGADEDYTCDYETGIVTRVTNGSINSGATVKCTYAYCDVSKVDADDIIGDTVDGERTGLQLFKDAYAHYGFYPKLIIAPDYCETDSVATEMQVIGNNIRAYAIIDAPVTTTFEEAIEARGVNGDFNSFNTSDRRTILCFPHLKVYDPFETNDTRLEGMSARLAGLICRRDIEQGYWWSPSNTEFRGITGTELRLTAMINDPESEVNLLNENGIVTYFNSYGTGIRAWGNRSAAFPTSTDPIQFIPIGRTVDIISESVEYAMLQFIDFPISEGVIQAVVDSVNGFLRTLVGRGALYNGSRCFYDASRNDPTEVGAGHLVFSMNILPPPPLERITFETAIDTNLLATLSSYGVK